MIKVLQLLPGLGLGGIETFITNYYSYMDKTRFHFDFAVFLPEINDKYTKLENEGSKIFILPQKSKGLFQYIKALRNILKSGNYDIVHAHQNYMSFIPLLIARSCGVKSRIAHSHTSKEVEFNRKHRIFAKIGRFMNKFAATKNLSCGELAGRYLFGNRMYEKGKVEVVYNSIDIDKFAFNEKIRDELRRQFKLENKIVIGTICRLTSVKNLSFIIDCMQAIKVKDSQHVFAVFGDGQELTLLKNRVDSLNLNDVVKFYGGTSESNRIYNIFDCFVLPSISEGYPVAAIEAAANGLKTFISDTVTKEISFLTGIEYLSLSDKKEWINNLLTTSVGARNDNFKLLDDAGLNIKTAYRHLEHIYEVECKNNEPI